MFRFAQLGDTQYVTNCLTQWTNTIDYLIAQKPQTVFQPGDLADGARDSEYIAQTNQLWRLVAAGIPLLSVPGNHDNDRAKWEQYVTPVLLSQHGIAETFSPGKTYDGIAMTQSFGGLNFVYIGLGPWSGGIPPVLPWLRATAAKYHDRIAIVVTHGYLGQKGNAVQTPSDPYYMGGDILETNFVSMTNLQQVLCGHEIIIDPNFYGPSVHHISSNSAGNAFHGLMFNFQISPPYVGDIVLNGFRKVAGVTWVRWYTWDPDANRIRATTWENFGQTNRTTSDCQFEFPIWQSSSNLVTETSNVGVPDASLTNLTNQLELCVPVMCRGDTNALQDFSYHQLVGVPLSNDVARLFPRIEQYIINSGQNSACGLHQSDGWSAVRYGAGTDFIGFTNLTLAAWVRTTINGIQYLIDKHNGGPFGQWMLQTLSSTKLRFFVITTAGRVNQDVQIPNIADGQWHHLAATYDGTRQVVYFDGVSVGTAAQTGNILAQRDRCLYVGGYPTADKLNWVGDIREVNVWSRSLSAAEVAVLYNSHVMMSRLVRPSAGLPVSAW